MKKGLAALLAIIGLLNALACSKKTDAAKDPSPAAKLKPRPASYKGPKLSLPMKFAPAKFAATENLDIKATIFLQGEDIPKEVPKEIPMNISVKIAADTEVESASSSSGDQAISFIIRQVKTSANAMGQNISYDSDDSSSGNPQMASVFRPIIGEKAAIIFDKNGKFVRFDGSTAAIFLAASPDDVASGRSNDIAAQFAPLLKEMYSEHWGEMLPKTPVGPGDRWEGTMRIKNSPMIGKVDVQFYCLLQDFEDTPAGKVAVIDLIGEVSIYNKPLEGGPIPKEAGAKLKNLDIAVQGTARFNVDLGIGTEMKMTTSAKGTIRIAPPGGEKPGEMRLDMNMGYDILWTKKP
jgi:hypothetical protein